MLHFCVAARLIVACFHGKMFLLIVAAMFVYVFVGAVITVDVVATTAVVVVATKGDTAAIAAVLFALPSMPLLLSYLFHNTNISLLLLLHQLIVVFC